MKKPLSTLKLLAAGNASIPAATAWYLSDLGEFRGKQELYIRQSPRHLKALRKHALIESAVSSNRIEGVTVEPSRVRDVLVSPRPLFRASLGIAVPDELVEVPEHLRGEVSAYVIGQLQERSGSVGFAWVDPQRMAGRACSWR
jgi:hypothetical protein